MRSFYLMVKPQERPRKTVPENGVFSWVPFCLRSLGPFERCERFWTEDGIRRSIPFLDFLFLSLMDRQCFDSTRLGFGGKPRRRHQPTPCEAACSRLRCNTRQVWWTGRLDQWCAPRCHSLSPPKCWPPGHQPSRRRKSRSNSRGNTCTFTQNIVLHFHQKVTKTVGQKNIGCGGFRLLHRRSA